MVTTMATTSPKFRLETVSATNLRGFTDTTLEFSGEFTLLVGPNNCGKTSILRLVDWLMNSATEETLKGSRRLGDDESRLLLPARATRNAARRLTLGIRVMDGRSRRRYPAEGEIVLLRVGVSGSGEVRLNVGPPRRRETQNPENRLLAFQLLLELRKNVVFTLIPAARDASSESFRGALREAAVAKLEERALHTKLGGSSAEYRAIKHAVDEINRVGEELVTPLWSEMRPAIPAGLVRDAILGPEIDARSLVGYLADNTSIRLVTGNHDERAVDAVEVGSGLQSLLELGLNRAGGASGEVEWILALEEPEAFLHPSAQRTLARLLRSTPARLIVSTHSAVLVDEARYGEIVLARRHRFYSPRPGDSHREAIQSALMTGHGAEMAFSTSLLLVEGEGDRLFFDRLRRRLAIDTGESALDELYVVPSGSKTQFAPWLRLVRGYGEEGDRPIAWLVLADDDGARQVRRAFSDAGVTVPAKVLEAIKRQRELIGEEAEAGLVAAATREINRRTKRFGTSFHLLPGQLEGAMLEGAAPATVVSLAALMGEGVPDDKEDFRAWLAKRKAPWRRAVIADNLPWSDIGEDVAATLVRWLGSAIGSTRARAVINSVR
jgi:energy-coupling factor transporter ATP-binding protein EcfA2